MESNKGGIIASELPSSNKGSELLAILQSKFGAQLIESQLDLGDAVVRIAANKIRDFCGLLKLDSDLKFNLFLSVTVVDWLDKRSTAESQRFEVVYHLISLPKLYRLRIKAWVPEEDPQVDSVSSLWSGADFMEREAWDMYGIKFRGHPNLTRILMYPEFVGHPLRKDYPLRAKQPRIPLRSPEVRNTAVDMIRPDLVRINARSSKDTVGLNGSTKHH